MSGIIHSVNQDSLVNVVKILAGEIPINTNNGSIKIMSRHSDYVGNEYAFQFLTNKLKSYNLSVTEQSFNSSGKNILAIQYGSEIDKYIIISAHYDCCGNYLCQSDSSSIAPGADDNASGVATTLECARIVSKLSSKYSIIYAFWDSEEQGWLGSKYYASLARKENKNIIAVINLDMIGWDSNNDGQIEIHEKDSTYNSNITQIMKDINKEYFIGLDPIVYKPGTIASDHYSFWLNNYDAILLIEGYYTHDFNKYYHSKQDTYDKFNLNFYSKASKLAIATVAAMAEIKNIEMHLPQDYLLQQNYPNPVNSQAMIEYSLPIDGYVKIDLYNVLGQKLITIVSEFKYAGTHSVELLTQSLSSGIYFYKMSANNFIQTKKIVVIK